MKRKTRTDAVSRDRTQRRRRPSSSISGALRSNWFRSLDHLGATLQNRVSSGRPCSILSPNNESRAHFDSIGTERALASAVRHHRASGIVHLIVFATFLFVAVVR